MKKIVHYGLLCALAIATACAPRERTIVLLSTNDIHAQIQNFPKLAAAVEACRDTTELVFLIDAGDRWTGNAYVDLAEERRPILDLMNTLGYDVATIGNHEFDPGHKVLGDMMRYVNFPIVCANLQSDTLAVPQPEPYVILEKEGVKVGFVGVVTNYEGNHHPAGQDDRYDRLTFPDPKEMAMKYAEIARKCDVLVLLSHMGTSHDRELLVRETAYNVVIGSHSHEEIDEMVNGTRLTQTGKNLKNIGVTTIHLRGDEVVNLDYRMIPLAGYEPDPTYLTMVERFYANPELQKPIGSLSIAATQVGLANLIIDQMADETDADVAFYHIGGVRVDSLPAGKVPLATIFDIEPFGSMICTLKMTPAQMRSMIISKFNDSINTKESHRIDLYSSTPYIIVVDASGDAIDVKFAKLKEGELYSVAVCDYIYKKYSDLYYADPVETELAITDLLLDQLHDDSPVTPDNLSRQSIRR